MNLQEESHMPLTRIYQLPWAVLGTPKEKACNRNNRFLGKSLAQYALPCIVTPKAELAI